MAIEKDLKIFISWSGTLAKEITGVLREWLPRMFDHLDPWASDVDIDAGSRGFDEMQSRLNESTFGIIVITTENYERPWLNFEAGALSKRLDGDLERVIPLLVNFDDANQLVFSPLHQFQQVILDKEGVRGICKSIAKTIGLDRQVINDRFELLWDDLAKKIEEAKSRAGTQPPPPKLNTDDLLMQVVNQLDDLKRSQQPEPISARDAAAYRHLENFIDQRSSRGSLNARAQAIGGRILAIAKEYGEFKSLYSDEEVYGESPRWHLELSGPELTEGARDEMMAQFRKIGANVILT